MFMNFFQNLFRRKANKEVKNSSSVSVSRAADNALKKYEKTFTDLARYDRGELVRN